MKPGTPGFVGVRLREAREARQLAGSALAELIGVSRQAVSQYENDRLSPSPEVMQHIVRVLRIPAGYFFRPTAVRKNTTVFYRSMSRATKAARKRAERRYEWLRTVVDFIEGFIELPEITFPTADLRADPCGLTEQDVEGAASLARKEWGLGEGPLSNVVWLIENNGAIVVRQELQANALDAFSNRDYGDGRPFFILGIGKASAVRSRFDASHELGHMLLHGGVDERFLKDAALFQLVEQQAHHFAGAFLLPESSFAERFEPSVDFLLTLKRMWKVSIAAMIKRAGQLRWVSRDEEQRLWRSLSRRGWRTREPLDDVLLPEKPRVLERAFDLLLDSRAVSPDDIESQLCLILTDVESVAGLPMGYLRRDAGQVRLLRLDT